MPERIFLTYTNATAVPYQGSVLGHHVVLNYIDSNGKHYTLQGMPEQKFDRNAAKVGAFLREEVFSDGASNRDSPFQRLRAKADEPSDPASGRPNTLIAEGDNLRSQWDRMTDFGEEVNSIGYEYRPYSQNSNSFAAAALKRGGFFGAGTAFPEIFDRLLVVDPVSGQTRPVRVPGFDQSLTNPLNKAAVPFPPANADPAGNGQESFDRRFGSSAAENTNPNLPAWMRDVGDVPRDADRKPVPYLGQHVVGKPEASIFDVGARAVPFVPSNEGVSPHRQNSLDNRFGNWNSSPTGITPRNPNLPLPQAEPGMPPGISSGKPKPLWTTPPPIRGSTDFSEAPDIGTKPVRYVSRRDGNLPLASVFDTGAPAGWFVLPDQLNASSGRTDWAAALAGLGPLHPMRAAPPPQRRDAFVSGNDALSRAAGGGSYSSRPGQSQGPTAATLPAYIRQLNQAGANEPQAPIFERGVPGASLAPSDSPSPMGGLAGRIAALAGIDPDHPDQPPAGGLLALLLAAQQR